jgi:hypothetical protein
VLSEIVPTEEVQYRLKQLAEPAGAARA